MNKINRNHEDYYTLRPGSYLDLRIKKESNGCWVWQRSLNNGYASTIIKGVTVKIHRCIYELVKGEIPKGLVLDHLCRNRACVNPEHLEPVTHKVNLLRGEGVTAKNANKTSCKNGHPFNAKNTRIDINRQRGIDYKVRRCRACNRASSKRKYEKQIKD